MSIIRQADFWLAKKLFFPIIVRSCQIGRLSQTGFAAYAMVVGSLFLVPLIAGGRWSTFWLQLVLGSIILATVVIVGITGELLDSPRPFWRGTAWLFFLLNLWDVVSIGNERGDLWLACSWLATLFAEYALMIDRIPPAEEKREEAQLRLAEARDG